MELIDTIREWLYLPATLSFVVLMVVFPLAYFKIVRVFDKQFYGEGLTFEEGVWFFSTIMRLSQYVLNIVFPSRTKTDKYAKNVYKGYNFRKAATNGQITISYWYLSCMAIIMFFGALILILDFIVVPLAK